MAARFTIVGLGEALFDIFPHAEILGGTPLNMAVHAHQLAQPHGGEGVVVSRVGQDDLGRKVVEALEARGMTPAFLQHDPDKGTGKVYVEVDADGKPTYDIVRDVAWDWLHFDPDTDTLAQQCDAVCFGSLAQRNGQGRNSIYRFLDAARRAVRLFDVNLRQNYFDRQILQRSCEFATAVKLNEEELPVVARTLGIGLGLGDGKSPAELADTLINLIIRRFNLRHLVFTRGERGTVIYTPTQRVEGEAVSYPAAANADSVGAGDACSAAVLVGLTLRQPLERVVALANHAGAFVASQAGATPKLPDSIIAMVKA